MILDHYLDLDTALLFTSSLPCYNCIGIRPNLQSLGGCSFTRKVYSLVMKGHMEMLSSRERSLVCTQIGSNKCA